MRGNWDDDTPFDEFFEEIEQMLNEMMGANTQVDFGVHTPGSTPDQSNGIHATVHEDDDTLRLVADLPGVAKSDIDIQCDGETLSIKANSENRNYRDQLKLPVPVDETSAEASYNNGVLEVTFEKQPSGSGTSINIE